VGGAAQTPRKRALSRWLSAALLSSLLSAALGLAAYSAPSAAETVYRWRDARGHLVVSDRPPADKSIPYERVETGRGLAPERVWQAPGTEDTPEAAPVLEPDGEADLPPFKKDATVCAAARKNLEILNTSPRVRVANAAGELVYLSEEERNEQREEARRIAAINCED